MLKLENIKIREDYTDKQLLDFVCKKYHLAKQDIISWNILKKSIDARKKEDVHYCYTLSLEMKDENKYKHINKLEVKNFPDTTIYNPKNINPVVVGAGPAGLFAALTFVQNGISPIIIEQGKCVEKRQKDVETFFKTGKLNISSNVQFGEGGAGTFSDGKLNSGIHHPFCRKVLEEFVFFGAPKQILYLTKPHIGTDNLIHVIRNMRDYIISKGGSFLFEEKVKDIEFENNKITSVSCSKKIPTNCVILAIGHSSRDTFKLLYDKKVYLEKKNFSVGLRIEHLQEWINKAQYGTITKLKLPPADYKLAYHSPSGRSCYTFCMCPGGSVIASSSENGTVVTNGMSKFLRNEKNANSAILVNITPDDFDNSSPLSGMYFQENLERKAFLLGGNNFYAPVQRVEDFINNTKSSFIGSVTPSYLPGYKLSNLSEILPEFVYSTLKEGILYFDKKLLGFANPDNILNGVETRSSSPIRIVRDETFQSNIKGLYPCGEGAGYAGGIMSASVDGIKCALAAMTN